MIAFLRGLVDQKEANALIIDVNGVGYQVGISLYTFEQLPDIGKEVKVFIYHHMTENEQRLFGFFDKDEKQLFEKVITVKGIGPKLGLGILSGMPASDLIEAISYGSVGALSKIPGIGKKTAERMVVELKDKVETIERVGGAESGSSISVSALSMEAVSALEALGYKKAQAEKAVKAAAEGLDPGVDSAILIKKALIHINRG